MRGSVVKKGARWYVKIELDPDPATGQRRQKWHSGYNTKREAERARVDLLSKFDRGEYVEPSHQTRRRLPRRLAEGDRAHGAAVDVRLVLAQRAQPRDRSHRLGASHQGRRRRAQRALRATADVRSMQAVEDGQGLLAAGGRAGDRASRRRADARGNRRAAARRSSPRPSTSPRTRSPRCCGVASPLRRRRGRGPVSIGGRSTTSTRSSTERSRTLSAGVGSPGTQPTPPTRHAAARSPTASTRGTRRRCARSSTRPARADDRLHALWVLLATTGMRRGEALGLRWSDVDLDAGRLRVVQTIIQTRSKVTIGEPKTAQGRRPIALDKGTVAVLRDHRRRMLEERLLVGPDFDDQGLVFHQPDGSWLRPDAVSEMFLRRVRRYGLRAPHPARPPPHLGDARARAGHPPASRAGAPRPLDDRDHPRHLQPRRPDAPRRSGRDHLDLDSLGGWLRRESILPPSVWLIDRRRRSGQGSASLAPSACRKAKTVSTAEPTAIGGPALGAVGICSR